MAKAAEWVERVEAWRSSGSTAREYCKGKGFTASSLLWWSSQLQRAGTKKRPSSSGDVRLARVVRSTSASAAPIVVHVGDARVEVSSGADAALLWAVMDALISRRGLQR